MKDILIIDNYDSFTYNLVQYVRECDDTSVTVKMNDEIQDLDLRFFDGMIISPGPGLPSESGLLNQVFADPEQLPPTLGVCLGHQAIAESFGGSLFQLADVFHGVDSTIHILDKNEPLFFELDDTFTAGRYHSWVVKGSSLEQTDLFVTCQDENGLVMGIRHAKLNIHGVQFHPESVMTPSGRQIISNFLNHCINERS